MVAISVNIGYVKSTPGILKIVEFFLLLLAFSCVSDCCHLGSHSHSRIKFYIAVTVIAWIVVGVLFLVFFLNLNEKIKQVTNWDLVVFIVAIVFLLLLFISGALLADLANDYRVWKSWTYYGWDTLVAGIAFGFFAMVAFVVDIAVHLGSIKFRVANSAGSKPPA